MTPITAQTPCLSVPESPVRTPGKISVLRAVLLSAWLVALLLATRNLEWSRPRRSSATRANNPGPHRA
jgi:hypothetical protein